jgi:hypothetical protein
MDPSKPYFGGALPQPQTTKQPDPMELLTLKDHPKYKSTPQALISEDLNFLLSEIVHCDEVYCYDLRDMIFEAIQLVLSHQDPKTMNKITRCTGFDDEMEECTELYANAFAQHNPAVFQMIQLKRKELSPDPLEDYDGTLYESPFWFQYAGDVWRRITHKSKQIDIVRDCARLKRLADQCLKDDEISHKDCLTIYSNSLACAPGAYCPYLRQPLMTCMHGSGIAEYDLMRDCINKIPNYTPCQVDYTPPQPKKPVRTLRPAPDI